MKINPRFKSSQGFTLIEIMVAVVIIGLLASMAIPAFNRIRRQSRQTTLINDGRILGTAAQQYFMTTGQTSVRVVYNSATGEISGDLRPWISAMTPNYTFTDDVIDTGRSDSFSITLPNAFAGLPVLFSDEGQTTVFAEK